MTFKRIYERIQKIIHDHTATGLVDIKEAINEAYNEICNLEDWWWLKRLHEFYTKPSYNAGSVSVEEDSNLIAGSSTAFAAAHVNMKFVYSEFPEQFTVSSVVDVDTIKLSEDYTGDDDSGDAYCIFEKEISLPSDFRRPFKVKLSGRPLDQIGEREMKERIFPRWAPSRPTEYTLTVSTLLFNSCPDEKYYGELWFWANPTVLSGDSDVPVIPAQFHQALVLGGYLKMNEGNEDIELNPRYEKSYERILRNLFENNERDSDQEDTFKRSE